MNDFDKFEQIMLGKREQSKNKKQQSVRTRQTRTNWLKENKDYLLAALRTAISAYNKYAHTEEGSYKLQRWNDQKEYLEKIK